MTNEVVGTGYTAAGAATGEAQATGQTLAVASSLIEGTEAGEGQASGATVAATAQPVAGDVSGDGNVAGVLIGTAASTISGEAAGAATTDAVTTSATTSIIAGAVDAGAQADGATLSPTAALVSGDATGAAVAVGDIAGTTASLIDGQASGGAVNGTAQGATVEAIATLIDGVAAGVQAQQQSVGGGGKSRKRSRPQPVWYDFTQGAIAKGVTLSLPAVLIAGYASGDAHAGDVEFVSTVSLKSGRAKADAKTVPVLLSVCSTRMIAGKARGEATTKVVLIHRGVTLTPGKAEGFDAIAYDNTNLITLIAA